VNLRTKFILWTGSLIVVIITLTAALIFDQGKKALKDERGLRGISLANHLMGISREPLLMKDDLALHSLVGDIVKNEPDVVYAYVGDLAGERIFIATFLDNRDVLLKEILSIKPSGSEKVALQTLEAPYFSDIVDYSIGIAVQKKTLGVAHIGISEKGIRAALAKIRNKIIPFSILSICIFCFFGFWSYHPCSQAYRVSFIAGTGCW